ncbi:ABC transporter substrate-binding protein [Streptomyces sp. NBC_01618]|uniref:ABC transporter substrate-binding protein n=1 Tax=Streptomyces sp. NBC_01618 TaxID=2975900 RepID=UPI0038652D08|nr:ABC transporter substrate-binding protein [Streptomyces sp. NBC_01618]
MSCSMKGRSLLAVSSVLLLAACGGSSDGGKDVPQLRMQLFPSNLVSFYPQVADKEGIFKDNKLDVKLVPVASSPQALSAMLAGSLDLAPGTSDSFLLAKAKGTDAVAVAANTAQPVFQIVASSKYVAAGGDLQTKAETLTGKPIAVYGRGGTSDRFVNFLFESNKIASQPDYVIAGAAKTTSAFLADKVEFASDTVQIANLLEAAGKGGTYINCAVDKCAPGSEGDKQLYWTTAEFAEKNPDTVKRFIAAMDETNKWVHDPANKDAVIAHLKEFFPAPGGIDGDKYANLLYQSQLDFINSTELDPAAIKTSMNRLLELGQLKKPVDVKSMVWSQAPVK